jgi:hypothetical protein
VYLLFIDESGDPSLGPNRVSAQPCVIAGVAIPDGAWRSIDRSFRALKARYRIDGEIKWRDFGSTTRGPLAHLSGAERDALRNDLYQLITNRNAIRIICAIGTPATYVGKPGPFAASLDGFYRHALKALSERYQYFLQDISRETATTHNGLLVCDARDRKKDQRLVEAMHNLMTGTSPFISNYDNIVEGLFMADSHLSTGVQLADMVAGAIWHKEARGKDRWFNVIEPRVRRDPAGSTAGWGIVRLT